MCLGGAELFRSISSYNASPAPDVRFAAAVRAIALFLLLSTQRPVNLFAARDLINLYDNESISRLVKRMGFWEQNIKWVKLGPPDIELCW